MTLAKYVVENVGYGQRLCNCANSQFYVTHPGGGGGMEQKCEIFLIELNQGYVEVKYELAKYVVEKINKGQKLGNSAKSEFLRPHLRWGESMEQKMLLFFSDRP